MEPVSIFSLGPQDERIPNTPTTLRACKAEGIKPEELKYK